MSQIHFVHEHKPGTSLDSTQVRALRSHVRKVNLERSNQKIAQRLENFRSLTIADFVQGGKTKSGKKRSYSSTDPGQTASPAAESPTPPDDIPTPSGSSINIIADVPTRAFESLLSHEGDTLPRECECSSPDPSDRHSLISGLLSGSIANYQPNEQHPYASQISRFVDIDERRIDSLLKSCAFQVAAAPLHSPREPHRDPRILSRFPDFLAHSAFLYALLYSILHAYNGWHSTNESLLLKIRAIECLKEDLHRQDPNSRALSIGTSLILSGVAHRSGDHDESAAHSEGLSQLLQCCRENETPLRPEVLRAIFWQDLLGTALVGDRRTFLQVEFPSIFSHSVEFLPRLQYELPAGFVQHQEILSDEVLLCIREVVYLHTLSAMDTNTDNTNDGARIDHIQVSIESRLVFHEQACKRFGLVAECCRLATYIVCYVSHASSSAWNSSFVPLRLAEKILTHLEMTSASELWVGRRDLFLWFLLVGASVCRYGTNCFALALMPQYERLIARVFEEAKFWTDVDDDGSLVVQGALEGFIYAPDWVQNRHVIPNWVALEKLLLLSTTTAAMLDEDIVGEDPT